MKEFVAWLGILGIPSIFSMCVWCIRSCLHYAKQLKILIKAQQAQMRSQLIEQYHQYIDQAISLRSRWRTGRISIRRTIALEKMEFLTPEGKIYLDYQTDCRRYYYERVCKELD